LLIDKDWAYLFFDHAEHTLSSVTRFSPALLSGNNVKLLFLVFQLVKIFQVFAQRNIYTGDLNLKDFAVTETLEVQLRPVFSQLMSTALPAVTPAAAATTGTSDAPVSIAPAAAAPSFCDMVEAWVGGSLSNLDYLLYLNRLAGRSNGDPNFHPVLPWVSDFSSDSASSLRDLTKSKFRLNKGDEALDRTFERFSILFPFTFRFVYYSGSTVL
jgi:WD repeat-containing protein 81